MRQNTACTFALGCICRHICMMFVVGVLLPSQLHDVYCRCFGFAFNCSMSGSSNDHLRRANGRPSDASDIFRTLSPRQLLLLYGVLTNNNLRPRFMDELQDIVVANADSIVRGDPPQKAMPKILPKINLRPRGSSTAPTPYRPPASSIVWSPNVATYVTPPPPPPPPPKSPPSSDEPRPSGLNSVKAFCAKAVGDAAPKGILRHNSRSRSRSRSRSPFVEAVD